MAGVNHIVNMKIIKIGGGKNVNWDYVAEDIAALIKTGEQIILVHGASVTRDEIAAKLGTPTRTITSPSGISSVFTDQEAINVFLMVYAGLMNKTVVAKLQSHGINAVGLSGVDGRLWEAKKKGEVLVKENNKVKMLKGNLTGRVEKINTGLLDLLISNNYVPVLCPPAISYENEIVNTDNDWAVSVMAAALQIKEIIVLFEAPGLLRDHTDETTVIPQLDSDSLSESMQYAQGRMKKKLLGAKKALEAGVEKIYWGDARVKNPIINVLQGKGTIITR